jgi:hypothetical protein
LTRLVSTVVFLALFAVYLLVEVVVAMLAYTYLALNHTETFGVLVEQSYTALTNFITAFRHFFPDLTSRAFAGALGELGGKSVLLLFIGLVVSALARLLVWSVHLLFDGFRSGRAARAARPPERLEV